jgi:hypothetical protein
MNKDGYWPYTPSTNLLYGLSESLDMLLEEGLDNVFARHQRWAAGVRAAIGTWGLPIQCADPAAYSPVLTGVLMPAGVDADAIRRLIYERFDMSLGTGLGKIKGRMFRIGHLGDSNDLTLLATLAGCEMGLELSGAATKMPCFSAHPAPARVTWRKPSATPPSTWDTACSIARPALLDDLAEATLDGTRKEHMEFLVTVPLLILDDLGMRKLPLTAAEELLEIIMRRYERASTMLTSNRPVEDWGKLLGDAAAVSAMLDRLLHHGHVFKCGPRSWRTKTDLPPQEAAG